jgi:hypothetical protein
LISTTFGFTLDLASSRSRRNYWDAYFAWREVNARRSGRVLEAVAEIVEKVGGHRKVLVEIGFDPNLEIDGNKRKGYNISTFARRFAMYLIFLQIAIKSCGSSLRPNRLIDLKEFSNVRYSSNRDFAVHLELYRDRLRTSTF